MSTCSLLLLVIRTTGFGPMWLHRYDTSRFVVILSILFILSHHTLTSCFQHSSFLPKFHWTSTSTTITAITLTLEIS
ncbi:hypothetical protein B0H34DRAFT_300143 [Crassisporium funariophilum]|nr:hypothetical protein B0H34DRAFT_300143 [Crassisporium funariophilum]